MGAGAALQSSAHLQTSGPGCRQGSRENVWRFLEKESGDEQANSPSERKMTTWVLVEIRDGLQGLGKQYARKSRSVELQRCHEFPVSNPMHYLTDDLI